MMEKPVQFIILLGLAAYMVPGNLHCPHRAAAENARLQKVHLVDELPRLRRQFAGHSAWVMS